MRKTPIPLLRNLRPGCVVVRCQVCNELVMMSEECEDAREALRCQSRAEIDGTVIMLTPAKYETFA